MKAAADVVILAGMYVRTVRVRSSSGVVNEYVRVVEAYRENGKVKQRVVADLGRKDVLSTLLFEASPQWEREQRMEGKYVVATTEKDFGVLDAVRTYKDLTDLERGFRHVKDVLAVRPIYHRVEPRVRAHIFVAALALLVERLLERRLREAGVDLSAPEALEALATIRLVTFRLAGQPARRGVRGGSPDARQVLKALGIHDLKPPTPPKDQETVV